MWLYTSPAVFLPSIDTSKAGPSLESFVSRLLLYRTFLSSLSVCRSWISGYLINAVGMALSLVCLLLNNEGRDTSIECRPPRPTPRLQLQYYYFKYRTQDLFFLPYNMPLVYLYAAL